jgi:hypothetical protein
MYFWRNKFPAIHRYFIQMKFYSIYYDERINLDIRNKFEYPSPRRNHLYHSKPVLIELLN